VQQVSKTAILEQLGGITEITTTENTDIRISDPLWGKWP